MSLAGLLPYFAAAKPIEDLIKDANDDQRTGRVLGVLPAAVPAIAAALQRAIERPVLIVVGREDAAYRFYEQMRIYSERPDRILFFPAHDALAYERLAADVEKAGQRLEVLAALRGKDAACEAGTEDYRPPVIIASAKSITQLTMSREDLLSHIDRICVGERFPITKAITRWVEMGYEPVAQVEEQGTFARRGGIVDIFPTGSNSPVRLDFFGDEVDSIRQFDPATQRSEQKIAHIAITPATEAPLWRSAEAYERLTHIDCSVCRPEVREEWENILSNVSLGNKFEGVESFLEAYSGRPYSILDHLPENALTIIVSPDQVGLSLNEIERQAQELRGEFEQQGELPPEFPLSYLPPAEVQKRITAGRFISFGESSRLPEPDWSRNLSIFEAPGAYAGQIKRLVGDVREGLKESHTYVVASPQCERLRDIFEERDIFAVIYKRQADGASQPVATGALSIFHDDLALGWKSEQLGVSVLTDAEVFGWTRPVKRVTRAQRTAVEAFETDLKPGDYVVHITHGIARYDGLIKMETNGEEREYLLLQYAGMDRLYVPVDQLDRLTPYVTLGQAEPALNKLGTVEWTRTKRKVKKAVADLAKELLEIYSAREAGNGHAFAPDGTWQRELEDSFPYVETPDQMRAILDVKADMEQPKPMDRLICGDVGYGKTEVAVRAAFKAVADGKQVAVLVPTTVLAQQHYRTFSQRLASFPVRVEVLSRFRSRKEQKAVVEDLEKGQVDIIIGTHRLLQKDVKLKDLGLIIVDEEQRFGVRHKEALKKLRKEVDVLTMTATPIPRTLHMALSGVRDMSVIETPPEQRLPIKTYVTAYSDSLVREVILREMSRGGQIYYVHNRVQSMPHVLRKLNEIVPEAKVIVGHGQMEEGQLEKVMMSFVEGEYDVLLCTTIIESGLDIPNVNTLIIDDATHFGLAQLYQLRGRVGRSSDRAYAYFLYDPNRPITIPGQQRLETIQEATELGAGFRVAMRDLEIRGAGNLLGPEQAGHVASIGFDLYSRLLAQAVQDYKAGNIPTEEAEEEEAVSLDLPLSAYLPNDYVENDSLRLKLYRDAAKLKTTREINDFRNGLIDRFGPAPAEVDNLLYLMRLRNVAQKARLASISASDGQLVLMLQPKAKFSPGLMSHVISLPIQVKSNQIRIPRAALGTDWREKLYDLVDDMAG